MWKAICVAAYFLSFYPSEAKKKKNKHVNCGGHIAESCAGCGREEHNCNGDCRWMFDVCMGKKEAAEEKKAKEFYAVLGVPKKSDDATIKSAYKKLALEYHPDKCTLGKEECDVKFRHVAEAFEVLGDKKMRRVFDKKGYNGVRKARGDSGAGNNDPMAHFFGRGDQEEGSAEDLYGGDSAVTEITGETWNSMIGSRDAPWIVQFYKPNDEDCTAVAGEFKKFGTTFKEFLNVGAVNCRQQNQLCEQNSIGSMDHPAVRWYPADNTKEPEICNEEVSAKALGKWVNSMLPDYTTTLTDKRHMREWLDNGTNPAVVLFTDKKESPPMWKALSSEFNGRIRMASVTRCDKSGVFKTELQREYDVYIPGIIRIDPLGAVGSIAEKFPMELKKDKISLWLTKLRLVSKKDGPTATFKEWTRERVKAGDCGVKDSQICFLWLKGGMDKKVEAAMRSLAEKYRTDPIKMMWVGIELNPSVLDTFGLEESELSDFLVAYKPKRGKFMLHDGELEFNALDAFVDGVLNGGRALTSKVQINKLEL